MNKNDVMYNVAYYRSYEKKLRNNSNSTKDYQCCIDSYEGRYQIYSPIFECTNTQLIIYSSDKIITTAIKYSDIASIWVGVDDFDVLKFDIEVFD